MTILFFLGAMIIQFPTLSFAATEAASGKGLSAYEALMEEYQMSGAPDVSILSTEKPYSGQCIISYRPDKIYGGWFEVNKQEGETIRLRAAWDKTDWTLVEPCVMEPEQLACKYNWAEFSLEDPIYEAQLYLRQSKDGKQLFTYDVSTEMVQSWNILCRYN